MKQRIAAAGALSLLCACSFAPPYHVPTSAPALDQFKETADWKLAQPSDRVSKGEWWAIYGDDALDSLETRATQANQTLLGAFARLQEARADTRIARADLFPTIAVKGTATRARASPNSPTYITGSPTEGSDFDLEADLSYEIDLWGRVRNEVAAARANQQASAADLASIQLSIHAEVATDYFGDRKSVV